LLYSADENPRSQGFTLNEALTTQNFLLKGIFLQACLSVIWVFKNWQVLLYSSDENHHGYLHPMTISATTLSSDE
jgi:hypothetical protein